MNINADETELKREILRLDNETSYLNQMIINKVKQIDTLQNMINNYNDIQSVYEKQLNDYKKLYIANRVLILTTIGGVCISLILIGIITMVCVGYYYLR